MPPTSSGSESTPAIAAALHARDTVGDEAAAGDDARRDAFAALLYGMAVGFASRDDATDAPPLAERVEDVALQALRQALRLGFRDANRSIEAIGEALASDRPDPAILGMVHAGAAAAGDWLDGDRAAFEARVMQATLDDALASGRALRRR
jgi:hypothetical protein